MRSRPGCPRSRTRRPSRAFSSIFARPDPDLSRGEPPTETLARKSSRVSAGSAPSWPHGSTVGPRRPDMVSAPRMKIGVAKEIKQDEYRVALTPAGALELVQIGRAHV